MDEVHGCGDALVPRGLTQAIHGGLLKDLVHRGQILFFVMKTKCNLVDAGWEDFLDSLGLAFMGACR